MRRFIACMLLAASPLFAGKDYLGADWESYSGFEVETGAKLPEREVHPSLWFSREELLEFRKRLNADATAREYWNKVKNHEFLTSPFPVAVSVEDLRNPDLAKENGERIHKYYGEMTQIPLYCGFMAWMSSDPDEQKRYIDRAKAALMRAFDGPIFELDPAEDGVDKSVDEIYRGVWAQSICAAYDFVQPFLTPDEDAAIRERLLREARYTHSNLDSWASGPHNHLSKPAWGLATFALTFSSEPDAADWFRNAMQAANRNTHYHFSADGIYREGAMYYVFSWLNFVPFLYHCVNVTGVDYFKDFMKAFEWGVIARNAAGWMMNLEDSFIRPVPTQMVSKAFRDYQSFLAPGVPFSEVLQWNFQTTDYEPFLEAERTSGFNYTGASWDYPKALYDLITWDPSIKSSAPTVDPTIFMEGGQTIFRSSWLNEPDPQLYLLFHSVPHADNHDHNDTLSFVMYAKNQMMASDSGYTRQSYGDDIRYSYYRRPQAHNTITFDDIPLGDFVENQPNPSRDRLNTSFFDFEMKHAPFRRYLGEELGWAKRSIAFIQDEYFLVLDEVQGPRDESDRIEGKFDVFFHPGRASLEQRDGIYVWSYDNDSYGSESRLLTYQLAPGATMEVFQAESTYIKKDFKAFPALRTTRAGHEGLFGQVLYPLDPTGPLPVIEDLSSEKLLAATITRSGRKDVFIKSHTQKKSEKAGLSVDGDFAWVSLESGALHKVAGQSVKHVSYKGFSVLESSARISFALKIGLLSELGVAIQEPARISLHLNKAVESITQDGEAIPFKQSNGLVVFSLTRSGNYLIR